MVQLTGISKSNSTKKGAISKITSQVTPPFSPAELLIPCLSFKRNLGAPLQVIHIFTIHDYTDTVSITPFVSFSSLDIALDYDD